MVVNKKRYAYIISAVLTYGYFAKKAEATDYKNKLQLKETLQ